jgi:hypothetical protein
MEKQKMGLTGIRLIKCKKCGIEKPEESYYKSKLTKSGLRGSCKECTRKQYKHYREFNKEKVALSTKRKRLKKEYGITPEEYDRAMASSTVCEICGNKEGTDANSMFCYDHCHTTGKFRGVLCRRCNQAIGTLGDTADSLKKAYEYLEGFEENN